jgi:uncharacterized protein (DUF362 family)
MSRREFFARVGSAVGLAVGSGALGWLFHNRRLVPEAGGARSVGSYAVTGTEGRLVVARGTDGGKAVAAALAELGGIGSFVKRGDRVLVKPNCAFDRPPHLGATSSPDVVAEVVRQCVAAGATVRVTDNPINNAEGCFVKSGLREAVGRSGGTVWLPAPELFAPMKVGRLAVTEWEALYAPLAWATKVIGVPTVKTHNLCGATLAMKNWYGLMGGARNRFHQVIHDAVADLAAFITPTLVVLDGTRLLVRNGPTGGAAADVAPGNVVALGTDQVAVDAFGAGLLGLRPADIGYIGKAEALGLGVSDPSRLKLFKEITT